MNPPNVSEKPTNQGFSDALSGEPGPGRDVDARVKEALRACGGASFADLVNQGVVGELEAKRARDRLVYRGEIVRVGQTRAAPALHDCPHCRCDVGGRPRAIYQVVEEDSGP